MLRVSEALKAKPIVRTRMLPKEAFHILPLSIKDAPDKACPIMAAPDIPCPKTLSNGLGTLSVTPIRRS